MSKAVVSTTIGAEGLSVTDGTHLLLADDPRDFAQRTVELLNSEEQRIRLGENGHNRVVEHYGWDRMAKILEAAWLELASQKDSNSRKSDKEVLVDR